MKPYGIIYIHTNMIDGKVYIGKTTQKDVRRYRNGKGYANCVYFQAAIDKYGWENFSHKIIAIGSNAEELKSLEEKFFREYDSTNPEKGYNIKFISEGHEYLTEEIKEKISDSHLENHRERRKAGIKTEAPNKNRHILVNNVLSKKCKGTDRPPHYVPLDDFGHNSQTWDKKHRYCKECWRLYVAKQREKDPPKKLSKQEWDASYKNRQKKPKLYNARLCEIQKIDSDLYRRFVTSNHRQKHTPAAIIYGLYFELKLVAIMSFGVPRFNKNYEWELIRFCSLEDSRVRGGASKLLSFFVKTHKPKSMITYANKEYSDGNLYNVLGFTHIGDGEPNYQYVRNKEIVSRYQAQKHKLSRLLGGGFDPDLTEKENMIKNGFVKEELYASMVFVREWNASTQGKVGEEKENGAI